MVVAAMKSAVKFLVTNELHPQDLNALVNSAPLEVSFVRRPIYQTYQFGSLGSRESCGAAHACRPGMMAVRRSPPVVPWG